VIETMAVRRGMARMRLRAALDATRRRRPPCVPDLDCMPKPGG
jgi:hypothetical protein